MKDMVKEHGDRFITVGVTLYEADRIPTGIFEFDYASGGGIPFGRLTEIFGAESSCKTNLVLKAIANCLAAYPTGKVVFIDAENAMDGAWMKKFGIDPDRVIYIRPDYGEQIIGAVEKFLEADDVLMVIVDSIAHVVGMAELEQDELKSNPGHAAQLVQRIVKRGVKAQQRADISHIEGSRKFPAPALVFINQIRMKIGVMYGSPETTPGGQSPKFAAGLRVRTYGKNEFVKAISTAVPAKKIITASLVKWKVPILATTMEFAMAMLPHEGLKVGQCDSWNTVEKLLKHHGFFWKGPKKWHLNTDAPGKVEGSMEFDTIKQLRQVYDESLEFRTSVHMDLIKAGRREIEGDPEIQEGELPEEFIDPKTGEVVVAE